MTMSDKTIQNTTVGTVQPGALTAIARKEDFLQHLQDFLNTHKTEKWCVAAIDVEHFRLYNELYGTEQGNTLLNTLASHLLDYQKTSGCPVGYWGNDDFFLCLPDDRVQQQDIVITLQTCVSPNHQDVTFFLALGLCPVSEHPEADAATLCNYAQIAVMNPDHSGSGIHRFAPAMLDSLKAQQQLLSELEHALDNHEFTFFLQPKCNSMTRAIVGTTVGTKATIVPLVAAAFPFVARLVETSLRELDEGVVEAAQSMGATPFQIITKVMIPECLPGLISSMTTALTTILGYSAMSGVIGGGGLGKIALSYGYYRYQTNIMIVCVVLLVLMVQVFQTVGTFWATKSDKRLRK